MFDVADRLVSDEEVSSRQACRVLVQACCVLVVLGSSLLSEEHYPPSVAAAHDTGCSQGQHVPGGKAHVRATFRNLPRSLPSGRSACRRLQAGPCGLVGPLLGPRPLESLKASGRNRAGAAHGAFTAPDGTASPSFARRRPGSSQSRLAPSHEAVACWMSSLRASPSTARRKLVVELPLPSRGRLSWRRGAASAPAKALPCSAHPHPPAPPPPTLPPTPPPHPTPPPPTRTPHPPPSHHPPAPPPPPPPTPPHHLPTPSRFYGRRSELGAPPAASCCRGDFSFLEGRCAR